MAKFMILLTADDAGKLLKSGVPLDKISPVVNPVTRRSSTSPRGRLQSTWEASRRPEDRKGRKGHVLGGDGSDIVGNKDAVIGKIKEMVQVQEGTTPRSASSAAAAVPCRGAQRPPGAHLPTMPRSRRSQPQPPTRSSSSSMSDVRRGYGQGSGLGATHNG